MARSPPPGIPPPPGVTPISRPARPLVAAVVLGLVLGSFGVPGADVANAATTRKVALGVSMAASDDVTTLDDFTTSLGGHAPRIWAVFSEWGSPATRSFPSQLMKDLEDRGVVPMVNWLPVDPRNLDSAKYRYKRIIRGAFDAYIRAWARAARDHGGTILLRFAPEMNGHWFPWGIGRFDNTARNFKKAWRHVWKLVRGAGGERARNVKFLWSPNKPCKQCRPDYPVLYPGDGYVHYVGFSSFNWGARKKWTSMPKGYERAMGALGKLTKKRVIVAETASHWKGGDKAAWIRYGYRTVFRRWPKIKGIVYLNVDMRGPPFYHPDWRLTKPAEALTAYAEIAAKPKFQGTIK